MTYEKMKQALAETGIKYAYYEFNGPVTEDRYIAYYEDSKSRVVADDSVYAWDHNFTVELYTKRKEPETEQLLIDIFKKTGSSGQEVKQQELIQRKCS